MGLTESASLSFDTKTEADDEGANVGYFVDVSRRKLAMSAGGAFVLSTDQRHLNLGHLLLPSDSSPASCLDNAMALSTSRIPPRQARSVFQSNSNTLFQLQRFVEIYLFDWISFWEFILQTGYHLEE